MTDHADIVRERVSHIARGCRAGTSHNPAVYENDINAALDALVAERDEARKTADGMARAPYGEFEAMRVRAEAAEKERDEWRQAASGRTVSCSQCDKANADWHRMRDLHADALTEVERLREALGWVDANTTDVQARTTARAALAPKEEG